MPELSVNKKAFHEYEILERFEAGIVLTGAEVKSVRGMGANMKGSFASIHKGELLLTNLHIPLYEKASKKADYDPIRTRKLLIHKKERNKLIGKLNIRGLTLVPLRLYTNNHTIKVEIGLARGKKAYEKRDALKKRDIAREINSVLTKKHI